MNPDMINGLLESIGGLFIVGSIFQLYKDKRVLGIYWPHPIFFTAWGFWNLFYYPHLEQWFSFYGSVFLVVANAIWLGQIIYYKRELPHEENE